MVLYKNPNNFGSFIILRPENFISEKMGIKIFFEFKIIQDQIKFDPKKFESKNGSQTILMERKCWGPKKC